MEEELTKEEADNNIAILQEMNELAKTNSKNVQQARMNEAPVRDVESSLASFTKHTFNIRTLIFYFFIYIFYFINTVNEY